MPAIGRNPFPGTGTFLQIVVHEEYHDGLSKIVLTSRSIPKTEDRVGIRIMFDESVSSYERYVVYGYMDWLASLGGTYTICVLGFLTAGYWLVIFTGDPSHMGILPELSLMHQNQEEIAFIKRAIAPPGIHHDDKRIGLRHQRVTHITTKGTQGPSLVLLSKEACLASGSPNPQEAALRQDHCGVIKADVYLS